VGEISTFVCLLQRLNEPALGIHARNSNQWRFPGNIGRKNILPYFVVVLLERQFIRQMV
jgi:hypothetical protein